MATLGPSGEGKESAHERLTVSATEHNQLTITTPAAAAVNILTGTRTPSIAPSNYYCDSQYYGTTTTLRAAAIASTGTAITTCCYSRKAPCIQSNHMLPTWGTAS